MTFCCGLERSSKFCSDCGVDLHEIPIEDLRRYILSQLQSNRTRLSASQDQVHKNPDAEWCSRRVTTHEQQITKWESWLKALDDLIKKGNTTDD